MIVDGVNDEVRVEGRILGVPSIQRQSTQYRSIQRVSWKRSRFMGVLPLLPRKTSPRIAAVLGFFLGPVGVGLYFNSFIDFLLIFGLALSGAQLYGDIPWLFFLNPALISIYAYFRSKHSNKYRLAAGR